MASKTYRAPGYRIFWMNDVMEIVSARENDIVENYRAGGSLDEHKLLKVFVGIDPSLTGTGLALIACESDGEVVGATAATVKTTNKHSHITRLNFLRRCVKELGSYRNMEGFVDCAVIEDLPIGAHGAGLTGMAQGVVRMSLEGVGNPSTSASLYSIPPASLKKWAVGSGRAGKMAMIEGIEQKLQGLYEPEDDNQADALWMALLARDIFMNREETEKQVAFKLVGSLVK